MKTTTSNPNLLPEILDHIIDLLHNNPETLKKCCLISKSWVPRARKHLFADTWFHSVDNLKSWKKTFPNPAKFPACHAHALFIGCPQAVEEADGEEGGWIQTFSRVERLAMGCMDFNTSKIPLFPFHRF